MTFKLFISDELRDFLRVIETQSVIAQLLLGKVDMGRYGYEYANHPVNYISISHDDRTKISYLSGDKSEEDLQKIGEDAWSTRFRYKAKPGTFVRKLFKNIPAKDVEIFSNLYCGENKKPTFTFKVVQGEDIRKYYHYPSYAQSSYGSLPASCMRYDNCQAFLEIYIKNPNKIKMLVMLNAENLLMGRSLLWEFDGFKLMDRIYTINDEMLPFQFKKWATENNYLYKSEQNWYNSIFFENMEKEKQELRFKINLVKHKHEKYPYLDTFKFLDAKGNLYNYIPENVAFKTLTACDGGKFTEDVLRFDHIDRVLRHRGECILLDYLGNDIYTSSNNTCYSGVNNKYILRRDSKYNEEVEDNIFIGEYEHLNNEKEIEERKEYVKKEKEKYKLKQEMLEKQKKEVRSFTLEDYYIANDPTPRIRRREEIARVHPVEPPILVDQQANEPHIAMDELDEPINNGRIYDRYQYINWFNDFRVNIVEENTDPHDDHYVGVDVDADDNH
jgi:hypothetical protein